MRAGVYCRISRDELGEGLAVERQEHDCRQLCQRRDWTVSAAYVDNDLSAFSGRTRPAYQQLFAAIRSRQLDVVVAWAPERLHRSPRELEDFLELIEATGTAVETVKAGAWDVSSSHGRLVARMLGAVSRAESERIGERVSRAHQQAKEHGLWRGPIPYGLRASIAPGRPELDEEQAVVVREVYARVLRGDALTRIAADLNAAGSRPRRGQAWTHTGLSRLIASPALGGLVEIDGEFRPAAFDGVVDPEQWRMARAALRRRNRGETRRPREKLTLLGGIMTCAEHGHPCFGGSAAHASIYVAGNIGACHVSITRAAADAFVTQIVVTRLGRADALQLFLPEVGLDEIEAEVRSLHLRRDELADLLADGLLTGAAARPRLAAIAQRLASLEAQRTPRVMTSDGLRHPTQAWTQWSMTQRREALRILFSRVALNHVGPRGGPRADPRRIALDWAIS
jgi:site-specific DNA recombinase